MFSDSLVECTGFIVTPDTVKNKSQAACQTAGQVTEGQGSQTVVTNDSSVQTELLSELQKPCYDIQRLASFLSKVYPQMVEELNKEILSYSLHRNDSKNSSQSPVSLHSMNCQNEGKAISSLSWNSEGTSLAVAFSENYHESWCTHDSVIHIYSANSGGFNDTCPKQVLNINSCSKIVRYHPKDPSILAAGLTDGQLLVWNFKKDISLLPVDAKKNSQHSQEITNILWMDHGNCFFTSGKDGLVILWGMKWSTIEIKKIYFIPSIYYYPKSGEINSYAEISSLGVWTNELIPDFIVAIMGGNLLHCSISSTDMAEFKSEMCDPVIMNYKCYSGIITCIECLAGKTFATCGTNSEIHIYNSKEKCPIYIIHSDSPLFGIECVVGEKDLIACWGSSPKINFYNTSKSERLETYSFKLSNSHSEITAANLSKKSKGLMAVGTQNAELSLWIISQLCS